MGRKKKAKAPFHMTSYARGGFVSLFRNQLNSPAYITLSPVAKVMFTIMREELKGWEDTNRVICPYSTFVSKGISRNSISHNLKLLEALGFIDYEKGGLGRQPNVFKFSSRWKDIKTIEDANKIVNELKESMEHDKKVRSDLYNKEQ